MLSTPPAFILSQDQTLKLKFVSQLLTDFLFPKITFALSSFRINFGFWFIFNCSVFKVQCLFCFQLLPSTFYILSHLQVFVKNFFIYFFQVFNLDLNLSVFVCRFSRRQDSIILSLRKKSTLFLNFFQLFSKTYFQGFTYYILYLLLPIYTYFFDLFALFIP